MRSSTEKWGVRVGTILILTGVGAVAGKKLGGAMNGDELAVGFAVLGAVLGGMILFAHEMEVANSS